MKRIFVTAEIIDRMRKLESEGKVRREIARLLDVDPSTVTKKLGSVHPYRGERRPPSRY